jgi:hypothetical protein
MNLKDYLSKIRKVIDNPGISVPMISQEVESFSNDLEENNESEDIKIWDPKSIKEHDEPEYVKIWDPKQFAFNGREAKKYLTM